MKITLLFLIALSISLPVKAALLPHSKEEYCARLSKENTSLSVKNYSANEKNLMSFKNDGGLFNGGVCWWHSRFQRNALYLGVFKPEKKYRSINEVRETIQALRRGVGIVEIKEFSNFADFTKTYQKEIQSVLDDWQIFDGVFQGMWVNGLKGKTSIEPKKLQLMMDELYQYVEVENRIAYQKLQIKGITAHAWLIVGMKKTEGGHEIGLIDSNWPNMSINYSYKIGDKSFNTKAYGDFVPYLEFKREEQRLQEVASSFCKKGLINESKVHEWEDNYWLDVEEAKAFLEDA